jgi:hypothetical protein
MQETNLIGQEQPVGVLTTPVPAPAPTMTLCSYSTKLTQEELARVATPAATATHKPIPHIAVVEKLIEALGFRQIGVVREEYAVSAGRDADVRRYGPELRLRGMPFRRRLAEQP